YHLSLHDALPISRLSSAASPAIRDFESKIIKWRNSHTCFRYAHKPSRTPTLVSCEPLTSTVSTSLSSAIVDGSSVAMQFPFNDHTTECSCIKCPYCLPAYNTFIIWHTDVNLRREPVIAYQL